MLQSVREECGHEYLTYSEGHTIEISSHALERIEKRSGEKTKTEYKDAAISIAKDLVKKGFGKIFSNKERFAVRSEKEGIIVIFGADNVVSEEEFTLIIITVWNPEIGTFYFRKDLTVIDAFFSKEEGVTYKMATDVKRSLKNLGE